MTNLLIILIPFLVFFLIWFLWLNKFSNRFCSQGGLASKLSEREINQWKDKGLSGSEAGRSYNNGWIDSTKIKNGLIDFYANHKQNDKNLDPLQVNKFQLDICYQILHDISQDNNLGMNYNQRINQLDDRLLPQGRKKINLFIAQNERKWDLINDNIKNADSVEQVNQEVDNIDYLDDYYSRQGKTKDSLITFQNTKLNSFLNEEQRKVLDLVIRGENIFFTGSAGTGKSFLLQRIVKNLELSQKRIAITAPTGIAAVNIGGNTIHAFSGIGKFGDSSTREELVDMIIKQEKNSWSQNNAANNWRSVDLLIIDEISMLSGTLFDKLEYIARKVRKKHLPFGGLQLVLSGDFFQLPPINSEKLCFQAKKWNHVLAHTINLNKIYRQTEPKLINLLNDIRFGEISDESREILNNLEREPDFPNDGIRATQIVSTNEEKDFINNLELNKINEKSVYFKADDWEDKRYQGRLEKVIKSCLAVENLELKIGCQVMLIKNLRDHKKKKLLLVNGSKGLVTRFDKLLGLPIVKFENETRERVIEVEKWDDVTPLYKLTRASRTQIPLVLSWAITIHKSQGQSIERLKVDLSRIFERGQLYVALSRARSLKYLQVIGFSEKKVICDERVKKFYKNLSTIS